MLSPCSSYMLLIPRDGDSVPQSWVWDLCLQGAMAGLSDVLSPGQSLLTAQKLSCQLGKETHQALNRHAVNSGR